MKYTKYHYTVVVMLMVVVHMVLQLIVALLTVVAVGVIPVYESSIRTTVVYY